jgi:translation elongation factor EF-G
LLRIKSLSLKFSRRINDDGCGEARNGMDRFIGEYEHVINDLSCRILNQSEPIQLNYSTLKLLTSRSPSTEIYSAETTSSVSRDGCWIDKVALKRVDVQANRLPCNPEREIDLLTKLSHPNVSWSVLPFSPRR